MQRDPVPWWHLLRQNALDGASGAIITPPECGEAYMRFLRFLFCKLNFKINTPFLQYCTIVAPSVFPFIIHHLKEMFISELWVEACWLKLLKYSLAYRPLMTSYNLEVFLSGKGYVHLTVSGGRKQQVIARLTGFTALIHFMDIYLLVCVFHHFKQSCVL